MMLEFPQVVEGCTCPLEKVTDLSLMTNLTDKICKVNGVDQGLILDLVRNNLMSQSSKYAMLLLHFDEGINGLEISTKYGHVQD